MFLYYEDRIQICFIVINIELDLTQDPLGTGISAGNEKTKAQNLQNLGLKLNIYISLTPYLSKKKKSALNQGFANPELFYHLVW